jgi:hypothetical protein
MRAASSQPELICVKDRAGFLAALRAVMVAHYLTVSGDVSDTLLQRQDVPPASVHVTSGVLQLGVPGRRLCKCRSHPYICTVSSVAGFYLPEVENTTLKDVEVVRVCFTCALSTPHTGC